MLTFPILCVMKYRSKLTNGPLAMLAALCLLMSGTASAQTIPATPAKISDSRQQIANLEGKKVIEVRIINETGELIKQDPPDLAVSAGKAYDSDDERKSMRQLFANGDYADLRTEVTEVQGGVRVDFVARQNLFIGVVRVEGLDDPPNESSAMAALRLGVGTPFRESELTDALARLKDAMEQDGLYQAQVAAERTPDPETKRMNIKVRVTSGPRARLGVITLKNPTSFSNQELLSKTKLKRGKQINAKKLQRAGDLLRIFLTKKDFLGARATVRRGVYDAKTNLLPLELDVVAGSRVKVEVTGAKIPDKELRKLVPVYEEGAVDQDLLLEGQRGLRDYFERQGYFEAQVDYKAGEAQPVGKKEEGATEQVITYNVNRGPKQRLVGMDFEGEHYFGSGVLRSRMTIKPAAFDSPGKFSQRLLEDDVAGLGGLYAANGFLDVNVTSEIEHAHGGKENDLFVHIHVKEGAQTLVAKLTVEGNKALRQKELLNVIGSSAGEPYSDFNVAIDRDNILAFYYNEGFPNARFTSTIENIPAATSGGADPAGEGNPHVALTYKIEEGEQIRVSEVQIGGYEHTRRGVIAREVQVKPGEPLRVSEVIDTQRRLYNLGIFSRVTLEPQNPDGTDPEKALDVIVQEAKRYTFSYGGGIEIQRLGGAGTPAGDTGALEASPRVILELSKANLTGRADTLSFKVRASLLQGRGLISYNVPDIFGKPSLSFQATVFGDRSRDVTTFTSTRYEGTVQITERVTRGTSLVYSYTYRKVLIDKGSLQISPEEIPLFSQPTQVSEFVVSWLREHRDNPTDATRGTFNSVDFSLAGKAIGSSASFARVFVQNSTYYPLGRGLVVARSTRFGIQQTLPGTVSNEIPLPERFFAGGGTSLRGFGLNEAGPRDPLTGFPVGGQALLVFNQELRFPMRLPRLGTKLGGAIFYDAGNVFSRIGTVTLRTTPSPTSQTAGDLAYFSHTLGLGLRYNTPIGPVRVDLAYQLNPPKYFTSCTIGTLGCGANGTQLAQLPHFQFFFNLGDIF